MIAWVLLMAAAQSADPAAKATETLAASCIAHKFETPVQVTGPDGKSRTTKVKICGKPGQSDAEWAGTLKDAVDKVAADPKMSAGVKRQIVTALTAEIARLPTGIASAPSPAKPSTAIIAAPSITAKPPTAIITAPSITATRNAAVAARSETARPPEYSTYSPLPAPKPAATTGVALAPAPPPLPAPRLTLQCMATSSAGVEGPCDQLEREMLLTVRADENIPGGTSLRFVRRGDARADVALLTLRRGQSQRFSLPSRVCQGVTGSRVEIEVVRAARSGPQVVDTRGPFELRC